MSHENFFLDEAFDFFPSPLFFFPRFFFPHRENFDCTFLLPFFFLTHPQTSPSYPRHKIMLSLVTPPTTPKSNAEFKQMKHKLAKLRASTLELTQKSLDSDQKHVDEMRELAELRAYKLELTQRLQATEEQHAQEMRELADFRERDERESRRKRIIEQEQEREVLLRPNPHRFVLLPIQYPAIWAMYEKHKAVFWEACTF